jgi:PadR family transcriptional regulator PadR
MASTIQILKGLLEGCILEIINKKETCGYEICEILIGFGFEEITEGSVYPILLS